MPESFQEIQYCDIFSTMSSKIPLMFKVVFLFCCRVVFNP